MFLILLLALLVLSSCNPRLTSPQLVTQERYIYGSEFAHGELKGDTEWWRELGDSTLNALIDSALIRNKDLATAVSRIEQARANLTVVRANYLPSFAGAIAAGGNYSSAERGIAQSYQILPTASWEAPLFGSLRFATKGGKAAIAYQEWQYRGVRLSLIAEVATTYYTILQYKSSLNIARRSSDLRREMVVLIDSLFRHGYVSGTNLEQARSLLYTAEADIPTYERAVAESGLSLSTLLGEAPCNLDIAALGDLEKKSLGDNLLAQNIKVGIPSDILLLRPDVVQAYYTMQQQAAAVGLARSARFPSINISVKGGTASEAISDLFSVKRWIVNMAGTITQPIFNFMGLQRSEVVAREQYKQSLLAYEQTYIEAIADVEKALNYITTSHEELIRYAGLVESDRKIASMTYALYRNGLSAYLDVIDAERSLYASQMEYEGIVAQQYINFVNLHKAIGN